MVRATSVRRPLPLLGVGKRGVCRGAHSAGGLGRAQCRGLGSTGQGWPWLLCESLPSMAVRKGRGDHVLGHFGEGDPAGQRFLGE